MIDSVSGAYQVAQYTLKTGSGAATNYAAALDQALLELNASSDPKKFLVFASDGLSNAGSLAQFNTDVAALQSAGVVVNSIAVGASSACSGGTVGNLSDMAVNGGQCFLVPDPNNLPGSDPEPDRLDADGPHHERRRGPGDAGRDDAVDAATGAGERHLLDLDRRAQSR